MLGIQVSPSGRRSWPGSRVRSVIDGIPDGGRAAARLVRTAPRPVAKRGTPGRPSSSRRRPAAEAIG